MAAGNFAELTPEQINILRSYLLASSPSACVARELWSTPSGSYSAYRACIQQRKQLTAHHNNHNHHNHHQHQAHGSHSGSRPNSPRGLRVAPPPHTLPATVKYSFEGVKHVFADTPVAVTAVAFAALRSDLLSYGCADGDLWVVALPGEDTPAAAPRCTRTRKMHRGAVVSIDWSYDNSQLLSVGYDGSLCVWDAGDSEYPCIRSVSIHTAAFLCGRFHRVNFSLAMVGTSCGTLEIYNCSTGMLHRRYQTAPPKAGVAMTALDCSNHHVFIGDSLGQLHWYACEMHERQLSRLRPAGRLRLGTTAAPSAHSAVSALQYVPFCRATDSPVLMAALQDGSLCIVRANEARHSAELYLRRAVPSPAVHSLAAATSSAGTPPSPPPSAASRPAAPVGAGTAAAAVLNPIQRLSPVICPLSVIHNVPLITYGSDDTSVYIVDVTAKSFSGGAARGSGPTGGAAAAVDRPLTVTVLKAHRAVVTAVGWSYDESLLASADASGMLVLWQRSRLF